MKIVVPEIQKIFLELLCSAIWGREVNASLFADFKTSQWPLMATHARRQSVSALVADKILSLPQQHLPQQDYLLQLMSQIRAVEQQNIRLNLLLKKIAKAYAAIQIPFVVLKGPANAQNYLKPLLRAVGDLDLFLYQKEDYEKANDWIAHNNLRQHIDLVRDGHRAFELDGFLVENHKYITFFERKKYNKILQQYIDAAIATDSFSTLNMDGTVVKVLPAEINGCYIFQHLFFHFVHAGVGFRQFCDWILFLSKNREKINENNFVEIARSLNLLYPMQLFARAAVDYLEAPENIFPFQLVAANKYSHLIIQDILAGGNFGFHHSERSAFLWVNRWLIFKSLAARTIKFMPIAPSYWLLTPVFLVINRIKLTLKGY